MEIKKGEIGSKARLIQEMLCYYKHFVKIDGDFGPATEHGVILFQRDKNLPETGIVDDVTNNNLMYPLNFIKDVQPFNGTLNEAIVFIARKHLQVHPIEIGGQNRGPFVRFYMRGSEGVNYPWCAGFTSTIILQAFTAINKNLSNFKYQMSTNLMLQDAKTYKTLCKTPNPGGILLIQKEENPSQVSHAGIVTSYDANKGIIETIEGNTNDEGSREGYEVCARIRQVTNKYFINLQV